MAYTEVSSNEIPEGTQYYSGKLPLGDYNFYLQYDATTAKVVTRCDLPSGLRAATQRQLPAGAQLQQWRVEANETEASVYVKIMLDPLNIDPVNYPVPASGSGSGQSESTETLYTFESGSGLFTSIKHSPYGNTHVWASSAPGAVGLYTENGRIEGRYPLSSTFAYQDKTVYYASMSGEWMYPIISLDPVCNGGADTGMPNIANLAWTMLYGEPDSEEKDVLIARFAIDIREAGGYPGGGGGWISPGDWNIDPTTTLHLTVNGALSGRHNDPLNDTSYSYVLADKAIVKDYGCGGDGGNGGGGGGGASTIIVRQFATNKANYKDLVALAKRHGYGSGGGKGGKGGDGCILIYY